MTQMAVHPLRLHDVVVATPDLATAHRLGDLEDAVLGVDDQRHLAPCRDVLHRGHKGRARRKAAHLVRQRLDHGARRDVLLPCDVFDDAARILRHVLFQIGQISAQHDSGRRAGLALGLDHLEALELRMAEIKALAGLVVGAGMRLAELLRLGPGLERRLVRPQGVGRIQRVIVGLRPAQQIEFDETREFAQIGFARRPYGLERLLGASLHLKTIHRNKHWSSPVCLIVRPNGRLSKCRS